MDSEAQPEELRHQLQVRWEEKVRVGGREKAALRKNHTEEENVVNTHHVILINMEWGEGNSKQINYPSIDKQGPKVSIKQNS